MKPKLWQQKTFLFVKSNKTAGISQAKKNFLQREMYELRDKIDLSRTSQLFERKHYLVKFNPLHFHFVSSKMQVGV